MGFPLALLLLLILERTHVPPDTAADNERIMKVLLCVVLAATVSIASVITAIAPIVFQRNWRPLWWLIPLGLGWVIFFSLYDWSSLDR